MIYTWRYGIFHWLIHYAIAYALVWLFDFHLVNFIIPVTVLGYTFYANIIDHLIFYVAVSIVDLDHLPIFRKFGVRGIFFFGAKRISLTLHNFFILCLFASVSAFTALVGIKPLAILLFGPVAHMAWDMFEDAFVFRVSYRKWEKTWGLKTKELQQMWEEMQETQKKK